MNKNELINELTKYKHEEEWFEFKENWFEPVALGEYVSALSNSAALFNKKKAYFVWGINDKTHDIVGTDFDIHTTYKNEPCAKKILKFCKKYKIKLHIKKGTIDDKKQ